MTESMNKVCRMIVQDFAETSRKEKEMDKKKNDKMARKTSTCIMQAFLEVKGDKPPSVTLRPASDDSYPATLVILKDVVVEVDDDKSQTEDDAWKVCGMIADKCREAEEHEDAHMSIRNAMCEHLAYAYSILCDYVKEFDDDYTMSKETAETLIRGVMDRIVSAGKCIDLNLKNYRSED